MKKEHRLYGDDPDPDPIDKEDEEVVGNDEDETEGVPDTVNPDPR